MLRKTTIGAASEFQLKMGLTPSCHFSSSYLNQPNGNTSFFGKQL